MTALDLRLLARALGEVVTRVKDDSQLRRRRSVFLVHLAALQWGCE